MIHHIFFNSGITSTKRMGASGDTSGCGFVYGRYLEFDEKREREPSAMRIHLEVSHNFHSAAPVVVALADMDIVLGP